MEKNNDGLALVPFYVFEATVSRQERYIRRLIIALIVCVSLLFASNVAWLVYESAFDTITYSQDGAGINNVNTGEQGALNYGAASENPEGEKPPTSEGTENQEGQSPW